MTDIERLIRLALLKAEQDLAEAVTRLCRADKALAHVCVQSRETGS